MEVVSALKMFNIDLPSSELEIQNTGSTGSFTSSLVELQQEITILTTKYELFQKEAFEFNEARKKLEHE
jgi:hypothetical protein